MIINDGHIYRVSTIINDHLSCDNLWWIIL
jgi:hypothetical protein